ncbi:MAG: hypothetical protein MJZ76_05665 [Bacteroidales bacterium]|nr:hypothetical protein [Bacteroidales bacterium]
MKKIGESHKSCGDGALCAKYLDGAQLNNGSRRSHKQTSCIKDDVYSLEKYGTKFVDVFCSKYPDYGDGKLYRLIRRVVDKRVGKLVSDWPRTSGKMKYDQNGSNSERAIMKIKFSLLIGELF